MRPRTIELLDQTKQALKRIGLPIVEEKSGQGEWNLSTPIIHFDNGPPETIDVSYKSEPGYILISDRLAYPISKEKVGDMLEVVNELNGFRAGGTFYLDREAATVSVSDGFYINESRFDEVTFEKTLGVLMKKGEIFFPFIKDFLTGTKVKEEILGEIERFKKEAMKNAKIRK